ncbi:aminotransferase class I/II-fold pyridoxal phosphate-dependent enzyme [Palleronia sediminis]|uniref:Aminotransferase n=1 Tax=Palleronia sediminis TaxID=2547833 RepID=A0A4R6AJL3_9RHOB|nr:aminotransferase class I/II-fold pyridoxal phosphate-dependent enzyme [Palleronia sediminis]TDL84170.1 aminotransferase class I/II-fold pyridoxal phosphate-dependent enzyme [Palleronia sediminis]
MRQSSRGRVDPFIVMDVMERARAAEAAGRHIVHMEIGQPGTPAPAGARAALVAAMEEGPLGYTVALGLPALRARIARHYGEWYGVDLDPARVVVTAGASAAFVLAFAALFDAGQRVGLGLPGYPSYRHILKAMSLDPVCFETAAADRFQPVPGGLPADLAGLILASPGNPAGTMLSREGLGALLEAARARAISVVSDEIYHGIDYGTRAVSALELGDDVYVVNSFSKYFSMTGWRIGWLVVPPDHVRAVERLAQNMFICPSHAGQVAALAAFDCMAELEATRATYAANRALMLERLPGAGFPDFAPPDGAFYVYADVSHLTDDSLALSAEILDRAGVAVAPGVDFDPVRGRHMLRLSYAGAPDEIALGLDRLAEWVSTRERRG